MTGKNIKHIWLDFSETIALLHKEEHDKLRYEAYSSATGKELTPDLIDEYEELYRKYKNSNAAIFKSLGLPTAYWSKRVNSISPGKLYRLAQENIPEIINKLRHIVPVSIFSNIQLEDVLPALGINTEWFTHILSSAILTEPKPALEGFYKMVELSQLPPDEILYIGDDVGKDVIPAKTVGLKTGLIYKASTEADYCFDNFEAILDLLEKSMV